MDSEFSFKNGYMQRNADDYELKVADNSTGHGCDLCCFEALGTCLINKDENFDYCDGEGKYFELKEKEMA